MLALADYVPLRIPSPPELLSVSENDFDVLISLFAEEAGLFSHSLRQDLHEMPICPLAIHFSSSFRE